MNCECEPGIFPDVAPSWNPDCPVHPPEAEVERRVRELLSKVYLPEGVDVWMAARRRNFGGRSARELLDGGDADPVMAEVTRLVGGAW